jgi:hypothetical protein
MSEDHLFAGGALSDVLRAHQAKMEERASALPPERALSISPAELAAELVSEFLIEPLVLDLEGTAAEQDETQVDLGRGRSGRRIYRPGTVITYFVPFTGEADLFKYQPSTFTTSWPVGRVRDGHVEFRYVFVDASAESVKREMDDAIGRVRRWIGFVNPEVETFNAQLPASAQGAVDLRVSKVRADRDLVASLGVPLRRRSDAPQTYVAPAIRRRPDIRPSRATSAPAAPLEPVMFAAEYEHILTVVQNMVQVMERSPSAFAHMKEEDLRQHFLVQLNAQYEGAATGETFNFEGKTDILVRSDDRTVFIAECKFWGGPQALTKTIDQLLGYTSWRDTKTAILLFNRGRALSTVLEKIAPTVAQHDNFVREVSFGDETSFRFVLSHRDDPQRHLTLTVMVFALPTTAHRSAGSGRARP